MDFEKLTEEIYKKLKKKIEHSKGIKIFLENRSKFEGWLKVELIEILHSINCNNIIPEKEYFDIYFEFKNKKYYCELKTINTSYRVKGVINKSRPITKNINGILKDIEKLKKISKQGLKIEIFIVFPLPRNCSRWDNHIKKIETQVNKIKNYELNIADLPAKLYIAEIS